MRRSLLVLAVLAASALPAGAAQAQAPSNIQPPVIAAGPSNLVLVGSTISEGGSQWTAPVTALSIQWLDCDRSGQNCMPIAGATSQSYLVAPSDLGHTLRAQETASNGPDSATAMSSPVTVAEFPQNTSPPVITGKPAVGAKLGVTTGTWAGDGTPLTFTYQWEMCEPLCNVPIAGATQSSYTVPSSDAGHGLAVLVTASSDGGALSEGVYANPVTIPYLTVTVLPSPFPGDIDSNPMIPQGQQDSITYLLAHGGFTTSVAVRTPGRLEITWTTSVKHRQQTLASGQTSYHTRGNHTFRLRLTKEGKSTLRAGKRLALTIHGWYVTRNPSNLQWTACFYHATESARKHLSFGSTCVATFARPPRLTL